MLPCQEDAVLVAAVLLALVLLLCESRRREHFSVTQARPVVSHVDGMPYRVHEGHTGPGAAADTMAAINRRVIDLMRRLRKEYGPDREAPARAAPERRAAVARILGRYNPDHLVENSPFNPEKESSYSENKGEVLAMCIRAGAAAGQPATLHDLDLLTFVAYHEIAHLAVDDLGHPPRFWEAFKFLLVEADAGRIYSSPNYAEAPMTYCNGIRVDYSPRHDAALRDLD